MNKQNLLKAIELGETPGRCKYVLDNKPCCVIGWLGYIEGVEVERMKMWDLRIPTFEEPHYSNSIRGVLTYETVEELKDYDVDLLATLQCIWDGFDPEEETLESLKQYMVETVEEWDEAVEN